ncbi:hypothetical protein FQN57_005635 [Myotisia sp. PD_48]|nr:hypothetical protein FQN57_005635 [Myotisia sp. PD_48]
MSNDTESMDTEMADVPAEPLPAAVMARHYKSYKRKYGKQKIRFERAMKEGNQLVNEETRILNLSKRLKEQNNQLLELLLELNNTIHVPSSLRYKLETTGDSLLMLRSSEPNGSGPYSHDAETAREKLEEAKDQLLAGEIGPEECRELELSILHSKAFAPLQDLSSLLEVPHTTISTSIPPSRQTDMESTLGFLNPDQDAETSSDTRDIFNGHLSSVHLTGNDREREAAFRNPVSVYNWLRKNQPQVFIHDGEFVHSEKAQGRPSTTRASKRAPKAQDEDVYDDDGILIDITEPSTASNNRNKRKRDEDGVYNPKSGSSNRTTRKRRDEKRPKKLAPTSAA